MKEAGGPRLKLFLEEIRSPVRIPPCKGPVRDALLFYFKESGSVISMRASSSPQQRGLGRPEGSGSH